MRVIKIALATYHRFGTVMTKGVVYAYAVQRKQNTASLIHYVLGGSRSRHKLAVNTSPLAMIRKR